MAGARSPEPEVGIMAVVGAQLRLLASRLLASLIYLILNVNGWYLLSDNMSLYDKSLTKIDIENEDVGEIVKQ